MSSFTVSVDYSNVYEEKPKLFKNLVEVNVSPETTLEKVKATVLNYLGIPYTDLYFIELGGRRLDDHLTIASLNISGKAVLVLKCSDFNELYSRMRRDGKL